MVQDHKTRNIGQLDRISLPDNITPTQNSKIIIHVRKVCLDIKTGQYNNLLDVTQTVADIYAGALRGVVESRPPSLEDGSFRDGRFFNEAHPSYWKPGTVSSCGISRIQIGQSELGPDNTRLFLAEQAIENSLVDAIARLIGVSTSCSFRDGRRTWNVGGIDYDCAIAAGLIYIMLDALHTLVPPIGSTRREQCAIACNFLDSFLEHEISLASSSTQPGSEDNITYLAGRTTRKRLGKVVLAARDTHRLTASFPHGGPLLPPSLSQTTYLTRKRTRSGGVRTTTTAIVTPPTATTPTIATSTTATPTITIRNAPLSSSSISTSTPSTSSATGVNSGSTASTSKATVSESDVEMEDGWEDESDDFTPSSSTKDKGKGRKIPLPLDAPPGFGVPGSDYATTVPWIPVATGNIGPRLSSEELGFNSEIEQNGYEAFLLNGINNKSPPFEFNLDNGMNGFIEQVRKMKNTSNTIYLDTSEIDNQKIRILTSASVDDSSKRRMLSGTWRVEQDGDNTDGGTFASIMDLSLSTTDRMALSIYLITPAFLTWITTASVVARFFAKPNACMHFISPQLNAETNIPLFQKAAKSIEATLRGFNCYNSHEKLTWSLIDIPYPACLHSKSIIAVDAQKQALILIDGSANLSRFGMGLNAYFTPKSSLPTSTGKKSKGKKRSSTAHKKLSTETIQYACYPLGSDAARQQLNAFNKKMLNIYAAGRNIPLEEEFYKNPHRPLEKVIANNKEFSSSFEVAPAAAANRLACATGMDSAVQLLNALTVSADTQDVGSIFSNAEAPLPPPPFPPEYVALQTRVEAMHFAEGTLVRVTCYSCGRLLTTHSGRKGYVVRRSPPAKVKHSYTSGSRYPATCKADIRIGLDGFGIVPKDIFDEAELVANHATLESVANHVKSCSLPELIMYGGFSPIYIFYRQLQVDCNLEEVGQQLRSWVASNPTGLQDHPQLDWLVYATLIPERSMLSKELGNYFGPELWKGGRREKVLYHGHFDKLVLWLKQVYEEKLKRKSVKGDKTISSILAPVLSLDDSDVEDKNDSAAEEVSGDDTDGEEDEEKEEEEKEEEEKEEEAEAEAEEEGEIRDNIRMDYEEAADVGIL